MTGTEKRSSSPPTAVLTWPPAPPCSLEEARERSRAEFPRGRGSHLTFSTIVKRVFDPPGEDKRGFTEDSHLVEFLCVLPSQRRRGTRGEFEFDALHFYVPPTPGAPKSYDEIHFRKAFSHDVAFAIEKQNKVAAAIRKCGFVIDYSVVDAHLLVILGHLMPSPHGRPASAARDSDVAYDVHHNLQDDGDVQTQYFHRSSQTFTRVGENIPEEALPDYEAMHQVYQKPYLMRRVEDVAVIQAWESLTKERCMQWLAHRSNDSSPYWFSAFIYDKVTESGVLSFNVELIYQKLPVNCVPVSCDECRDGAEQESEVDEQVNMSMHEGWFKEQDRRVWFTVEGSDIVIDLKEM